MPKMPGDSPVGRCLSCGQPALLPDTLEVMVVCPRCGTEAKASDLLVPAAAISTNRNKSHDPDFVNAPTILAMPGPGVAPAAGAPGVLEGIGSNAGARRSRLLAILNYANRYVSGRRLRLVALFVLLCGIFGPVADWGYSKDRPVYTVLSGNLLLFVLWWMFFAWILSLRDEDGAWNGRLLAARIKVAWAGFWESVFELRELSTPLRLTRGGAALFELGCLLLAASSIGAVLVVIPDWSVAVGNPFRLPWWLGVGSVALGVTLMAWTKFKMRNTTRAP